MDTSMTAEQDITQFHSVAIGINGEIIRDENCTICELRKSKANIGDFSTISHFLKKLKNKQCTTSLILGGSISTGHGVKNHSNLYYNKVAEFLNDKFQCLNGNISSKHIMISFSKVARGSDYHLANLYSIRDYPRTFDLIFLDVTLNDITDNTKYSVSSGLHINQKFEILIRKLKELYINQNDMPLLLFLEIGWKQLNKPPYMTLHKEIHNPIVNYYDITVISSEKALHGKRLRQRKQTIDIYFADDHHFNDYGHVKMGKYISYFIKSEFELNYFNYYPFDLFIADPMTVSHSQIKSLEKTFLYSPFSKIVFDEDDGILFSQNNSEIIFNEGWTYKYETKKKKYGYISEKQFSLVIFKIDIKEFVQVQYLISYENIGDATVWFQPINILISDIISKHHENPKLFCQRDGYQRTDEWQKQYLDLAGKQYHVLNGLITDHVSIGRTNNIPLDHSGHSKTSTYLCVCSLNEQKFKLLRILSF